jgi:hypothetical protein
MIASIEHFPYIDSPARLTMRQAVLQIVSAYRCTSSMRLGSAQWPICNVSLRSVHISNVIRYFIVLEAPGHCPDRESLKTFA